MISWEGGFGWQGYALTGRPDFLNYLNAGDVSWDDLWGFYLQQQAAPPEAVRALIRLFHLFLSSEYDAAGCWLDPEGEIHSRLRAWAAFVLDDSERVSIEEVRADLAGLVGAGLVTPLYYQAAYLVFMETSVDQHATAWATGRTAPLPVEQADLPSLDERRLPIYHPGFDRLAHLRGDDEWNTALRSLLSDQYAGWNTAFANNLPDPDHEDVWTTVGGEG